MLTFKKKMKNNIATKKRRVNSVWSALDPVLYRKSDTEPGSLHPDPQPYAESTSSREKQEYKKDNFLELSLTQSGFTNYFTLNHLRAKMKFFLK